MEKQARDVEEIILKLDCFTKALANDLRVADEINTEMEIVLGYWAGHMSEQDQRELIKFLNSDEEPLEDFNKLMKSAKGDWPKNNSLLKSWFTYDAPRLSVWFAKPLETDRRFDALQEKFNTDYVQTLASQNPLERSHKAVKQPLVVEQVAVATRECRSVSKCLFA